MGKSKYLCSKCDEKHYPPTGKKCQRRSDSIEQSVVSRKSTGKGKKSHGSEVGGLDSLSYSHSSPSRRSAEVTPGVAAVTQSESDMSEEDQSEDTVQHKILKELQRVNARLDAVEDRMDKPSASQASSSQSDFKLSSPSVCGRKRVKSKVKSKVITSDSSSDSDDSYLPNVNSLRTSRMIQKKVDERLAQLEHQSSIPGNSSSSKLKSKRGGNVDVFVEKRVAWPHEAIFGGANRQRISYDQLSLTQFVQGFSKNILEETDHKIREKMLQYLSELMEDATDFAWASAKAAHAVLLCEMERSSVNWTQTHRIDRIRRAHAQKHTTNYRQTWGKNENSKRPWYCKLYQNGSCSHNRDHESGGKVYKHICAHCLSQGRQAAHPEKDCKSVNMKSSTKNE